MTAFGFKPRFVDPMLGGIKGGTIRADRKDGRDHAKPGVELQLYTGMRRPGCQLIMRTWCYEVMPIKLYFIRGRLEFGLTRRGLISGPRRLNRFARFDGFGDFDEMRAFWIEEHGEAETFIGKWVLFARPVMALPMGGRVEPGHERVRTLF